MQCFNTLLLLTLLVQGHLSASDSISKNEKFKLTGEGLIQLGTKLNKPFLKLIGKTVSRIENQMKEDRSSTKDVVAELCRLHPCSEWSEWSKCDANHLGDFGGQTRSRNCGVDTTLCKYFQTPTVVHDTRVCEHQCPKNYASTGKGFCLKFYEKKMIRDDAEKVCQRDGGHLVNVDSDIKVKYVNETILQHAFMGDRIWLDGRRLKQGAPFTYGYKSTDLSFVFWGDNDPDNGVDDLCIMYHKGAHTKNIWRWFDYSCGNKYAFICQFQ